VHQFFRGISDGYLSPVNLARNTVTPPISRVDHLQPQHLLERIEIVIAVQKLIPGKQAECGDPAVHSFPNGVVPSRPIAYWRKLVHFQSSGRWWLGL